MDAQTSAPEKLAESSPSPPPSPYVGPRPFRRGERLYGRQRAGRHLLDLLIAERIVLLYSPSGAGKTSLVQAQVIPALEGEGFRVLPTLRVNEDAEYDPASGENRYLESLKRSLAAGVADAVGVGPLPRSLTDAPLTSFVDYLNTVSDNLPSGVITEGATVESITQSIPASNPTNGAAHPRAFDGEVLIFDQFEEILTLDPTDHARKAEFFTEVGLALRDRRRWAVFVMREEFLAGLDPYLRALPTRLTNPYRLELLPVESALAAIQEPAQSVGVTFTDAAARQLVDDLRRVRVQRPDGSTTEQLGQFVEPVQLQVVCDRLWQIARPTADDPIDIDDIEALGSIDDALADYYADTVARVAEQSVVEEILATRPQKGAKSPDMRMLEGAKFLEASQTRNDVQVDKRQVEATERQIREWFDDELITAQGIRGLVLQGATESAGLDNDIIYKLGSAHLVRAEERRGATWFELAHDRLVEPVRRSNERWRERNLSILQRQAALWEAEGRQRSLLLTGGTLHAAERWATTHDAQLTETERQFLEASRAVRRRRRTRWGLALGGLLLAFIGVLALVLFQQITGNLRDAERISRSRLLAAEAQSIRAGQLDLALLLSVEALEQVEGLAQQETVEARSSLLNALLENSLIERYVARGIGGRSGVQALAFSSDGETLFAGGTDGSILRYDVSVGMPGDIPGSVGSPPSVTGERAFAVLEHPQRFLNTLALVSTGEQTVLASGGGNSVGDEASIFLWPLGDVEDNTAGNTAGSDAPPTPIAFDERTNEQGSATFREILSGTDGPTLAVLDRQRMRVWRLAPSLAEAESELMLERENVRIVALHQPASQAPDQTRIAISQSDGALVVDSLDETAPITLTQAITDRRSTRRQIVSTLAFNELGTRLAAGENRGGITVWDVATRRPLSVVESGEQIERLAFLRTPLGEDILLAGGEETLRLWRFRGEQPTLIHTLRLHADSVQALAVAPDGSGRFASGGRDGQVLLWSLFPGGQLSTAVAVLEDAPQALAISPDGRWLADGGVFETVHVRDVSAAEQVDQNTNQADGDAVGETTNRAFSGTLPGAGSSPLPIVRSLDFHPAADPPLLAVGDEAGYVTLWRVREGSLDLAWSSQAHGESRVNRVLFDPAAGRNQLFSGGDDGQVLRWSLPAELTPASVVTQSLLLPTRGVADLALNNSGDRLAVASELSFLQSEILVWNIGGSEPISVSQPLTYRVPLRSLDIHPTRRLLAAGYSESDGSVFASSTGDEATQLFGQQAIVWNWPNARWERALSRHRDSILTSTFSPDGDLLVTTSRDGTFILWDTASWRALGQPIAPRDIDGEGDAVNAAVFDPTAPVLYTAGDRGQILRWDIDPASWQARACSIANRTLSQEERRIYLGDADAVTFCDQTVDQPATSSGAQP